MAESRQAAATSGDDLQPLPIQELKLLAEGRQWQLDQHLSELESLTPCGAL